MSKLEIKQAIYEVEREMIEANRNNQTIRLMELYIARTALMQMLIDELERQAA